MDSLVGDVNSSLMTYRRLTVAGIEQGEPEKVLIGIDCMMELLLDDYALHFSDTVTMDIFREEFTLYKCDNCGNDINTDTATYTEHPPMRPKEEPGPLQLFPLVRRGKKKYVNCTKCNRQVEFLPERCIKSRNGKMLKLLPYPPHVGDVMTDAFNMNAFNTWARYVLRTIERHHRIQREHIGNRGNTDTGI